MCDFALFRIHIPSQHCWLRNSSIFLYRKQNNYTDYIESGGSHACGAGVVRRLISGQGVNLAAKANLSGYCCDVIFDLSWSESQPIYWLSCKCVTSRLEMGYSYIRRAQVKVGLRLERRYSQR
jgi:hypothetical protein